MKVENLGLRVLLRACTKLLFSLDQKRCSLREAFGAEAEQSGVPPSPIGILQMMNLNQLLDNRENFKF